MNSSDLAISRNSTLPFYYGWVMLPLAMLALAATAVGQTFGISTFNAPIRESLNLSHTQLAGAYLMGTLLGAIPITYFGRLMDRWGLRTTMLATLILLAGACLVLSVSMNWFMLLVAFCFLRMLGPGTLAMLSGNTLAFWFDRRLGLVEAFRKIAISVAMGTVPAINLWLLTFLDWRETYALWACVILVGLVPLFVCLFQSRPEDVGQSIDHGLDETKSESIQLNGLTLHESMRTFAFWAITFGAGLNALVMTAVVFNLTPVLAERGLSEWDHARFMSVLAACMAITQFIGGVLADYVPPKPLMIAGHLGLAGGLVLLYQSDSSATALLAGGLLGTGQGTFFGISHPLWARRFGRRHLGQITGFAMTTMVVSSSGGPFAMGLIKDWQGSFDLSLILFAVMPLPVIVFTLLARMPDPRDQDMKFDSQETSAEVELSKV
ncbi:MFS transporter [Thalassoglobus sp. JC818]|uniref:MFS transporter n=1 Tax=Thalassoglobus sp. JC818 TaxID=3232136 RepID=UPI00345921E5